MAVLQQMLLAAQGALGVISSVQYASIALGSAVTSNTATITGVTTARTALFYNGMRGDDSATNYDRDQAHLVLTSSTVITATRNTGTGNLTINVAGAEFLASAIVSVQAGSITLGSGVTSNTATISTVTTTQAAVIFNGQSTDNSSGSLATTAARVSLTSATQVTAVRNTGTGSVTVKFTVIDFAPSVVTGIRQGTVQLANVTSNTATITSVDPTRSMLVWGGYCGTSNSSAPRFMPSITLTNGTTVTGSRQVASSDTSDVNFTVIEFASGLVKSVNRGVMTIATSASTQTATFTAVDVTKSILNWLGCNNSQADTSFQDNYSTVALTNSTTVTAQRTTSDAGSSEFVGWELIEFY